MSEGGLTDAHFQQDFTLPVLLNITRYGTAGFDIHGRPAGSVMTVDFELDGVR